MAATPDKERKEARWVEDPGLVALSPCAHCRWSSTVDATCDAFPDGIPEAMLTGKDQHRAPVKGDNGIQFSPIVGKGFGEE